MLETKIKIEALPQIVNRLTKEILMGTSIINNQMLEDSFLGNMINERDIIEVVFGFREDIIDNYFFRSGGTILTYENEQMKEIIIKLSSYSYDEGLNYTSRQIISKLNALLEMKLKINELIVTGNRTIKPKYITIKHNEDYNKSIEMRDE